MSGGKTGAPEYGEDLAWGGFVAAARAMGQLAGAGVYVVHLNGVAGDDVDMARVEVVQGLGLLGSDRAVAGSAAEAAIIQAARKSRERLLAGTDGGADVDPAWLAVPWSAARVMLIEANSGGQTIAGWALAEVGRHRELARSEAANDAIGEGFIVVDGQARVALCTRRAAEMLGVDAAAIELRPAREALPTVPAVFDRLEPNEVARGTLGAGDKSVSYVAQHLAPAIGATEPRPGLVLRLKSERRFLEMRRGQLQLLSALRHDVRSPLTALRGLVSVLIDEPDMPREERTQLLELLRVEAERTVTWVEDYLILLRLRFEPKPSNPVMMSPEAPLRALEAHYGDHARERGVSFSIQTLGLPAEGAPITIEGEAPLVDAFCKNLVGHFLRLADSGASVHARLDDEGNLIVEGHGPGLFAQHPASPFTTLARSTAAGKRTPGVGLGLFLAKKVADVHGWPISVTAENGVVRAVVRWVTGSET